MIRVVIPHHLRNLAGTGAEVTLDVAAPVTQRAVLDALEARYPTLRGTIRDHATGKRRPYLRFFACEEDLSHASPDEPLPAPVAAGTEPFRIIGAIAGGQGDTMPTPYKPDNYQTVSPYLIVDDAKRTIDFLMETFDATELRRITAEDGSIIHAEVRIDDSVIMLSDAKPDWPAVAAHVHAYVADPPRTYRRALATGGRSVQEPLPDQENRAGVEDPGGTIWWIAAHGS